ncbi:unnamed protein product, partial [Brachionus calyciflorus]
IADMFVAIVVMPLGLWYEIVNYFPFNKHICIIWVSSDIFLCTCSIWHMCIMSMDRFFTIRFPLKHGRNKTRKLMITKIFLVWLISFLIASPLIILGYKDSKSLYSNQNCTLKNSNFKLYGSIFAFCIPFIIIAVTYLCTIVSLKKIIKHKEMYIHATKRDNKSPIIPNSFLNSENRSSFTSSLKNCEVKRKTSFNLVRSPNSSYENKHQNDEYFNIVNYQDSFLKPPQLKYQNKNTFFRSNKLIRSTSDGNLCKFKNSKKFCSASNLQKFNDSRKNEITGKEINFRNLKNAIKGIENEMEKMLNNVSIQPSSTTIQKDLKITDDFQVRKNSVLSFNSNSFYEKRHSIFIPDNQNRKLSYLCILNQALGNTPKRKKSTLPSADVTLRSNSLISDSQSLKYANQMKVSNRQNNEGKALKVLMIIFFMFVLFWAPFFLVNILSALCDENCSFFQNDILILSITWLGYSSSMINPIIYTMFNKSFRKAFINLLKCQTKKYNEFKKRRNLNKMGKMGSILGSTKNEDTILSKCPECSMHLVKINHFLRCSKCFFAVAEKNYFENKEKDKKNEEIKVLIDTSEKKYNLRNPDLSKKRSEPEVIDLIDSDDEVQIEPTKPEAVAREKSNLKAPVTEGKIEYLHKEWLIQQSDTESLEKMLRREFKETDSKNLLCSEYPFTSRISYMRLGGYKNSEQPNQTPHEVQFSEKDGILLKLVDNDSQINIVVGANDLIYCACIFYEPLYCLLIHIKKEIADLYLKSLKEMPNFENQNSIGDIATTRLILILDMKKEDLKDFSNFVLSYFSSIPPINHNRLNFIKLPKAKELLYNSFKSSNEKPEDIAKFIKDFQPSNTRVLLKYPLVDQPNCSTIVINNIDYTCLKEGEFLNDNIISFYLKYLLYEVLSPDDRKRTHIFDTFFYQKLTHQTEIKRTKEEANLNAAERRYLRVKNWTRNVNIFEKDFLIIPINKNVHWYLAIVCYPYLTEPIYAEKADVKISVKKEIETNNEKTENVEKSKSAFDLHDIDLYTKESESADEADPEDSRDGFVDKKEENRICLKKPIILIFDSLRVSKNKRVIATIKEYLECEWKAKYSHREKEPEFLKNMTGETVNAPLQTNYFDCGIYLLQYVESFFTKPIEAFNSPINLENWFKLDVIKIKRKQIKALIGTLRDKQNGLPGHSLKTEDLKNIKPEEGSHLSSISKKLKQKSSESSDDENESNSSHKNPKKMLMDNDTNGTNGNYQEKTKSNENSKTSNVLKIMKDLDKL